MGNSKRQGSMALLVMLGLLVLASDAFAAVGCPLYPTLMVPAGLWVQSEPAPLMGDADAEGPDPQNEVKRFDPIPAESPVPESVVAPPQPETLQAPVDIVEFDGQDPFAGLMEPVTVPPASTDPKSDTLRLGPKAPAQVGEVAMPFPTASKLGPPPQVAVPELQVVRWAPQGNSGLREDITVIFNQPMAPVTTLDQLQNMPAPVKVEPALADGEFHWLGTTGVAFRVLPRLPMATRFTVTVPQGTASAEGKTLDKAFSWSFDTPYPEAKSILPYDESEEVELDEQIKVTFNAAMDPQSVLEHVQLLGPGGRQIPLQLVQQKPVPAPGGPIDKYEEKARTLAAAATVVLMPKAGLQKNTQYTVKIKPGIRSVEGPLLSQMESTSTFRTFEPLRLVRVSCAWQDNPRSPCDPGEPISAVFNNALEVVATKPLVSVEPKVDDLETYVEGNTVVFSGFFNPSTKYRITVKPGFTDYHGQTDRKGGSSTVQIGPAQPYVSLQREGVAVVEPAFKPQMSVSSVNVPSANLQLVPVPYDQIHTGVNALFNLEAGADIRRSFGLTPIQYPKFRLHPKKDMPGLTQIDLAPAMGGKRTGIILLHLHSRYRIYGEMEDNTQMALIQVTDLAITTAMSEEQMAVLVTSLSTAEPLAKARVELLDPDTGKVLASGESDTNGMLQLPAPRKTDTKANAPFILVAKKDADVAFMLIDGSGKGDYISSYYRTTQKVQKPPLVALVYSERGLYRPGETVNVNAVVRDPAPGPNGDLTLLPIEGRECRWTLTSARREKAAEGTVTLSAFGTATLMHNLAKDAALGRWTLNMECGERSVSGSFDVQEYRTPEFKTSVNWLTKGENVLVHRRLAAQANGTFLFGAPMAGAQVTWKLSRASVTYIPPGNEGFSFEDIDADLMTTPRWDWNRPPHRNGAFISGVGTLDSSGNYVFNVDLIPFSNRQDPHTFTLEATVVDANHQAVSARTSVIAHWAERYVGLKLDHDFVTAGEPVAVAAVVTRLDGSRYSAARVDVRLLESTWKKKEATDDNGNVDVGYHYNEVEVANCVIEAGSEPGACSFVPPRGGTYIVRAETRDAKGRPNRTALFLYVQGDTQEPLPVETQSLSLVPDKKSYEEGETAKVLVRSPFPEGRGLLVVARDGIARTYPLVVKGSTASAEIPLEPQWVPGAKVWAVVSRGRTLQPEKLRDNGMPAVAVGRVDLAVSTDKRRISVDIRPSSKEVAPGDTVSLNIVARLPDGRPAANTNVAVAVVDEGVLSLTGYPTPNPLAALYKPRWGGVALATFQDKVVPRNSDEEIGFVVTVSGTGGIDAPAQGATASGGLVGAVPADGGVALKGSSREKSGRSSEANKGDSEAGSDNIEFSVRSLFASTAFFRSDLVTNSQGEVKVEFKMPDNLTEFRIMAVAASDSVFFGSQDSKIRASLPIMVRPAMPRFVNVGDVFEPAVVVTNTSQATTRVMVKMVAANLDSKPEVKKVDVPAGASREVRFKANVTAPGPVTVQFAAVSMTRKRYSDAASVTIPALVPATAEAFATYGSATESVRHPFLRPNNVLPDYGGLEVSMSSTALTGLQDALSYLVDYPYECTEQICSRVLSIISVRDIIAEFGIGALDSQGKADSLVQQALTRLLKHQRNDGGFGFWPTSDESWMFLTAYALLTLQSAEDAGVFKTTGNEVSRAQHFLKTRLQWPHDWEATAYETQAMAVLALVRSGQGPAAAQHLERLLKLVFPTADTPAAKRPLPLYAMAWLTEALYRTDPTDSRIPPMLAMFSDAAVETASSIHFSEGAWPSSRVMMSTDDRTDAIVLSMLLVVKADSPLIEKIVRGLMNARVQGRWSTTQANAFSLQAVNAYFRMAEKEVPSFAAGLWMGGTGLLAHRFEGRSMAVAKSLVPMADLLAASGDDLVVAKEGTGRLYYRLGLRYAPANLRLDSADHGFSVRRWYFKEGDKTPMLPGTDGAYHVRAGDRIHVRIQVTAPDRRYYVAVVDPMPAGVESENRSFVTTSRLDEDSPPTEAGRVTRGRGDWYYYDPWDYKELRDDRVQLFQDSMWGGIYEYTYTTRATTVGSFVVPPARAEAMYEPELFGRTGTETFVVEPE